MAEQPRVFAPIAGRNDNGVMLDIGGGTTLPFNEDELSKQGLEVRGNQVVYKPDIVITGKLGTDTGEGKPTGKTVEGTTDVTQPDAPVAETGVPTQPAPEQQASVVPQPAPVADPTPVTPEAPAPETPPTAQAEVEAPMGVPSDTDLEFATDLPPVTAGVGFGDVNRLVDEAIQGSADYLQGRTAADAEATVDPSQMVGEGRPLLLPREASNQNLPDDYYTRMFFTGVKNPEDETEDPDQFTLRLHDNFRNSVGFRKPLYNKKDKTFQRDADNYIVVDDNEFGLIEWESDDLDARTAQFIQEGGYAIQMKPELTAEDGSYNLTFPGDVLDAEIMQRSQTMSWYLQTPIYRYMSENGGSERVRQIFESVGVPLADQVYTMRRLADSPIFVGKDMPRTSYLVDNSYGGVLSLAGLANETTVDTVTFLGSWLAQLMTEVPELAASVIQGREADAPVAKSFITPDEEVDEQMAATVREARARAKEFPLINWAVDLGWDATQRYAEDHGLSYEQARAALMANRGFAELVNWFFAENLGFSGPFLALRARGGTKAARALDEYILETYGDEMDRRIYNTAGTQGFGVAGTSGTAQKRKKFEVIQDILARNQDTLGAEGEDAMSALVAGFQASSQFQALSKYQKNNYAAFWTREGYLAQRNVQSVAMIKELESDAKKAKKEYVRLTSENADVAEINKARSKVLKLNSQLAQQKAIAIMPPQIAALTKGEVSSAILAASGYAWAYELTDDPTTQDLATFLAIASGLTPAARGPIQDGAFAVASLLYRVPGVKQIMDNRGIAPPPKAVYDAQKTLTEIADPQLAAVVQENINLVGQSMIAAEEINRKAGKQVIDTSLFMQGLAHMSGITRLDAAVSGITANPKMGELEQFGTELTELQTSHVKRVSLNDQLAGALMILKEQVKNLPEGTGSANQLQEQINSMELFVKRQNDIIEQELGMQEEMWENFSSLVEEVLMSGKSDKYLGTELERLAQESAESGNKPFNVMQLVDIILNKDNLAYSGMADADIERVGRVSNVLRMYLSETESGLAMVDRIFDRALIHLSEFREGLPEGIGQYTTNWVVKQHQVTQKKFVGLYDGLDAKYKNHRLPVTTPFRFQTDDGEVVEISSILDYLMNGEFHLTGVGESLAQRVEGRNVDRTAAAVHGLMEESATATIDYLRKNLDGADDAFQEYINQVNVQRLAEEKPLLDPTKMTALDRWKYMGEALVEFELVESMDQYKATFGRLGLRAKDYRVLVSHLGATGAAAKGFAQYAPHELRARMVRQATEFEGNFFQVNTGEELRTVDPTFEQTRKAIGEMYQAEHLNVFAKDKLLSRMMYAIENGQEFDTNDLFVSLNKRFKLNSDNPDFRGFQNFWARLGGTRNDAGEYVIDLDTDAGKQIQGILQNWGTSLLLDSAAGKNAAATRYNTAMDIRARVAIGEFAGDPTAGRQIAARTGFMLPKDVPDLEEAYQRDLPWEEFAVLENLKGVVTIDGKKVQVPLVNLENVVKPIMPESVSGGSLDTVYDAVAGTNRARANAASEAVRLVAQERKALATRKSAQAEELNMYKELFMDVGKGLEPKQARQKLMALVAAGPGGVEKLTRFKEAYMKTNRAKFIEQNPNASVADIAAYEEEMSTAYKALLKNIAIDYLFEQAATAGAQTTFKGANGEFITANPAVVDGKVIFELLGMETRGGGISDRGQNFQNFFGELGASDVLDDIKFVAQQLFEAGPDGNIRISNLPTPINLNHIATRVVAGLRGQVSPRWLIIEHILRRRSIRAGEMFMTMMTDPEVGEALIELATKKDLTPKAIERNIDILWRITKHAGRTEYVEQEIYPALKEAEWELQRATAPAPETED